MTDVSTHLETAIDAYFAAWNETDPDVRTARLASSLTDDGRYVDPLVDVHGLTEVGSMMGAVQAQYPGMVVRRTSPIDQHHDVLRFHWEIVQTDGSTLIDGIDVVSVDADGRLAEIRGFFGAAVAS